MFDENLPFWLEWSLAAITLSPIAVACGIVIIDGVIKPMRIPEAEIDRMAVDLISRSEDPEGVALMEEHAARYRSDNFACGRWRRVRKRITEVVTADARWLYSCDRHRNEGREWASSIPTNQQQYKKRKWRTRSDSNARPPDS
jgi:hypothetical protein